MPGPPPALVPPQGQPVPDPEPDAATERRLVLLVEADPEQAHQLVLGLARHGVDAVACTDGAEALARAGLLRPDAVVAAAAGAGVDVATLVRVLHAVLHVPVFVGIGDGDAQAAAQALAEGAAACVARPYRLPELLAMLHPARIAHDHRREGEETLRAGAVELSPAGYWMRVEGRRVDLAPREFDLLKALIERAGLVVSRDRLWQQVWGRSGPRVDNTIAVHVKRLRAKLGESESAPRFIHTVRGVGYRLDAEG